MIVLHQGPAAWGLANTSPFCLKLESYLRMAGVPYKVAMADFRRAPKGKIPFIEEDGKLMGDSQHIIEHLERKSPAPLDARLGDEERVKGHLVRRLMEDSIYWHIIHVRWDMDEGWQVWRPIFESIFPPVIKNVAVPMIRRKVIKGLHTHGLGRHRREEILEMGKADISAVAKVLGDKPFLLGDNPTTFDATAYAFIATITAFPVDSAFRRHTLEQHNLVRYVDRFQQRFFANWSPPA
jgi:glutathione S-transferase